MSLPSVSAKLAATRLINMQRLFPLKVAAARRELAKRVVPPGTLEADARQQAVLETGKVYGSAARPVTAEAATEIASNIMKDSLKMVRADEEMLGS